MMPKRWRQSPTYRKMFLFRCLCCLFICVGYCCLCVLIVVVFMFSPFSLRTRICSSGHMGGCRYGKRIICMHVCMNVCMYVCMHVRMYACIHACMRVCVYAYMRVCMYACKHVRMYARTHARTETESRCSALAKVQRSSHVIAMSCHVIL